MMDIGDIQDCVENDRQCKGADKEADVESLEAVILTVVVAIPVWKRVNTGSNVLTDGNMCCC